MHGPSRNRATATRNSPPRDRFHAPHLQRSTRVGPRISMMRGFARELSEMASSSSSSMTGPGRIRQGCHHSSYSAHSLCLGATISHSVKASAVQALVLPSRATNCEVALTRFTGQRPRVTGGERTAVQRGLSGPLLLLAIRRTRLPAAGGNSARPRPCRPAKFRSRATLRATFVTAVCV